MATDNIEGSATDANGNPLENAVIALFLTNSGAVDGDTNTVLYTRTDSSGNYVIDDHPDADGTSQEWHVAGYYQDGTGEFNALSKPSIEASVAEYQPTFEAPQSGLLNHHISTSGVSGDVTGWEDQKGGLNLSGSASFTSSSIDGKPAIGFDGSQQLNGARNSDKALPYEQFSVMRLKESADSFGFMTDLSNNDLRATIVLDSNGNYAFSDDENILRSSDTPNDGEYHLFNLSVSSDAIYLSIDSIQVKSDLSPNVGPLQGLTVADRGDLGGFNALMDMAENLLYDPTETGFSKSEVMNYIGNKYPSLGL